MSTRSIAAGVAAAALALGLTACNSGDGEPEPAATDEPTTAETTAEETSAPAETETPTDEPGDDSDDDETEAPATGPEDDPTDNLPELDTGTASSPDFPAASGDLLHSTVRIGRHENFDRVVFDLIGTDTPPYQVQYVDEAVQDGSGRVVEVDGDAILEVVITRTRYPEEGEEYEGGPGTYEPEDVEEVEEVILDGTFEGMTKAFIGLDEEAPFRVFTLADPVRVVVDIEHTD